jgi:acyl-CoA synthetase (AMP-forming)/AMP-acid ligase II
MNRVQGDDIGEVLQSLRHAAPDAAERPAFSFYRGARRTARLTWRDLVAAVERTAAALAEEHGVQHGDRVALLSANNERLPIMLLAVMSLGAVAVPLNPLQEPDDWRHAIGDSGAVGVVTSEALLGEAAALEGNGRFIAIDSQLCVRAPRRGWPSGSPLGQSPAVILYTSGTTGTPKGVVLSHANLLANGRAMARHFRLEAHAQLAVMPLYHAHALGFGLMSSLVSQGHLVLTEGLDMFHWEAVARAEDVRVSSLVPAQLPLLLKARVRAQRLPNLEALLVSSAPLPPRLAHDVVEQTGLTLAQGWGLSEFTNFATCSDFADGLDDARRHLLAPALPSIGRPLHGVHLQARDGHGRVLDAGEKGELFVRGASRMLGYFQDGCVVPPPDDWLATGDEGFFDVDEHGARWFVSGRIKDLIIRDAEKISPLAIERRLVQDCPELQSRLAVVGYPHAVHGEEIGAYIEAPDGDGTLASRLARLAQQLPNALRPKVVLWGKLAIPVTHTGKVQRARLKTLFSAYEAYSGPTRLEPAA